MDGLLAQVLEYLASRGDFAVISGVLAFSLYRTIGLLIVSLEARIQERAEAEERAYKAMSERAAELEKARDLLMQRRRS